MPTSSHLSWTLFVLIACRIEVGPPGVGGPAAPTDRPVGEVWVYTSMYQPVIDALDHIVAERLPDVRVRWYQAGSEKVAQRAEAEWAAGGTRACLLMTSDPFWYAELKAHDRLAPHLSPGVLRLDRALVDPDGMWAPARLSLVVMARSGEPAAGLPSPTSFRALSEPTWAPRSTMGDPLASGTMFTTLAFLAVDPGWEALSAWRDGGMVAAGGNASVIRRLESGERDFGVVLLENLLMAARTGSPTRAIYPDDGAIIVPGPIALTRDCPNPTAARALYDLILSDAGQRVMVDGHMYAAVPGHPPPRGAQPLADIAVRPWSEAFFAAATADRDGLKARWSALMDGE
jgi:iron(III) transport system substrate-binding protein